MQANRRTRNKSNRRGSLYEGRVAEVEYFNPKTKKKMRKGSMGESQRSVRASLATPLSSNRKSRKAEVPRPGSRMKKRKMSASEFESEVLQRMEAAEAKKKRKLAELKMEVENERMKEVKITPKNPEAAKRFLGRMESDLKRKRREEIEFKNQKILRKRMIRKVSEEMKKCTFTPDLSKTRPLRKKRSYSRKHIDKLIDWKKKNEASKKTARMEMELHCIRRSNPQFKTSTGGSARNIKSPKSPNSNWVELPHDTQSPSRSKNRSPQSTRSRRSIAKYNSPENLHTAKRRKSSKKFNFEGKKYLSRPPIYNRDRKFQNTSSRNMTKNYVSRCSVEFLQNRSQKSRDSCANLVEDDEDFRKLKEMKRTVERRVKRNSVTGGKYSRSNSKRKGSLRRRSRSGSRLTPKTESIFEGEEKGEEIVLDFKSKDRSSAKKDKTKKKKGRRVKYIRYEHGQISDKKRKERPAKKPKKSKTEKDKKNKHSDKELSRCKTPELEPSSFVLATEDQSVIGSKQKTKRKNMFDNVKITGKKVKRDIKKTEDTSDTPRSIKKLVEAEKSTEKVEYSIEKSPNFGIKEAKSSKKRGRSKLRESLGKVHESIARKNVISRRIGTPKNSLRMLRKSIDKHLSKLVSSRSHLDSPKNHE